VEAVVERSGEESLVALKKVGARWCPSLAIECLAQAAGLLSPPGGSALLAAVPRFRLRSRLEPGEWLEIRVRLVRRFGSLMTARGELTVAGRRVADGEVVLAFSGDGSKAG